MDNSFLKVGKSLDNSNYFIGDKFCSRGLKLWNSRIGEGFTVFCEDNYYRARLVGSYNETSIFKKIEEIEKPELDFPIYLFQAVPQKERMELIIEKAVEFGVSGIIPIITEKSISISKRDEKQKKSHNWPKLALRASKQCRRAVIPFIGEEQRLEDAVLNQGDGFAFYLNEVEEEKSLKGLFKVNSEIRSVSVFCGPEGGFSSEERLLFEKNNIHSVSLGKRILRTETASIAALACINYEFN